MPSDDLQFTLWVAIWLLAASCTMITVGVLTTTFGAPSWSVVLGSSDHLRQNGKPYFV